MNHVGKKFVNNAGYEATIISYEGALRVTIRFSEPYTGTMVTRMDKLRSGSFKNRFAPTVFGVGIVGDAEHTEFTPYWQGMLQRAYDPKFHARCPSYKGVTVADEWHKVQVFQDWAVEQYYEPGWQLDKDWLTPGNRTYSPRTCVFVPAELNNFLVAAQAIRGSLPVGVCASRDKFMAQISLGSTAANLGRFNTVKDAHVAYTRAKEKRARELAEKWKKIIDPRLYRAIKNFRVKTYVKDSDD